MESEVATISPQAQMAVEVLLTGVAGKFIIDQIRRLATKLNVTLNKWLIRGIAFPIAYLILLGYSFVTQQPFHDGLLQPLLEVVIASMMSVATNEYLLKDKVAPNPTPPNPAPK